MNLTPFNFLPSRPPLLSFGVRHLQWEANGVHGSWRLHRPMVRATLSNCAILDSVLSRSMTQRSFGRMRFHGPVACTFFGGRAIWGFCHKQPAIAISPWSVQEVAQSTSRWMTNGWGFLPGCRYPCMLARTRTALRSELASICGCLSSGCCPWAAEPRKLPGPQHRASFGLVSSIFSQTRRILDL